MIGGIVAALVTGGGSPGGDTGSSPGRLPPGGQSTVVRNAPPPKAGDEVLAAAETRVHGVYFRVVVSRAKAENPKTGTVELYFSEYVGGPTRLLQRARVTNVKFFNDSVIANFKVEANADRTAGITFSWFHHAGDQTQETKHYRATTRGIAVY